MRIQHGERPVVGAHIDRLGASNRMARAALSYAVKGIAVIPLHTTHDGACSCGTLRCGSAGKHPRTRHGVHDATSKSSEVEAFWARWPDANLGIATGSVNGVVGIDCDSIIAHDELCAEFPEILLCRWEVSTGRGRHLYFRQPTCPIGNRARLRPNVDVRGDGGYLVAPPSMHKSGCTYKFVARPSALLTSLPTKLLDEIVSKSIGWNSPLRTSLPLSTTDAVEDRARSYLLQCSPAISGSGGHNTAFGVVCRTVRGFALDRETAFAVLSGSYNQRCQPPWSECELRHKIEHALSRAKLPAWGSKL